MAEGLIFNWKQVCTVPLVSLGLLFLCEGKPVENFEGKTATLFISFLFPQ